jgi:thioredoxin 1
MTRSILIALALTASVTAFTPSLPTRVTPSHSCPTSLQAVIDVSTEADFDAKISGSGDKLVVIDYSTTWCGPCKVIAPKFDELSDKYSDSVFIKVCA